ncbi:ureidoglycolate lyase (plasmid) [Antarctobacter heliothermus]|uniref:Ureidoglycolate lyase n=1 Tax=Antarctobacter heliothermus TaxID=74033 RepID=A0A222EBW9_9RHOB|nr:fumarylacetoacetate hydrolase family protein [Antarctobacter heliothermus]ASP23675.1 ureidoglycolate lyase [Antarctobacter heliothermus]
MRICRFNEDRIGMVEDGQVYDITAVAEDLGPFGYPLPRHDVFIAALPELSGRIREIAAKAHPIAAEDVRFLSPVANPGKLMAAPVNYMDHLQEAEEVLIKYFEQKVEQINKIGLFLKATSSLIGAADPIRLRLDDRRNDHEIELACVIGRTANHVTEEDALDYVAGYCVGLDITLRGPEERSLRKSSDTYSVLGPWMVTADEMGDPLGLGMHLEVNGDSRQVANTRDLIFSVPKLIALASRFYTLHPGDVLYTGTPAGVGEIVSGDVITATIDRVGTLTSRVA